MPGIARTGDIVGKGGLLTAPYASSVKVNDRPIALNACVFTPHPPCGPQAPQHCFGVVFGQNAGVTVEGQVPLVKGSQATCGDTVKTASGDVIIAAGRK
jgi:hypothetical protein